jgi:hypothetical protein
MITKEAPADMILAVIRPGHYYQNVTLHKLISISSTDMAAGLKQLVADGVLKKAKVNTANSACYFMPVEEGQLSGPMSAKPYQMSREMKAAVARCAELRVHPSKY